MLLSVKLLCVHYYNIMFNRVVKVIDAIIQPMPKFRQPRTPGLEYVSGVATIIFPSIDNLAGPDALN